MEVAAYIVGGLVLLTVGGEGVVRGAVGVARRLGLSELLIGLTLVGFGTSTPELLTSLDAALSGSPGIAIGNVVGSNISNILLILAIVALVKPVPVDVRALRRDGTVMVVATALLLAVGFGLGMLPRWVGGAFLLALIGYITFAWFAERRGGPAADLHAAESEVRESVHAPLWQGLAFAVGGMVLLMIGADLLVSGAIDLARLAGLSETVIGLTIVAIGTSLPELVASLAAALKGRSDVAFGNIVGSNIYNILGILGITALVAPLAIPPELGTKDWIALAAATTFLVFHAATGARIDRREGAFLLSLYGVYAGWLISQS